jgi:chromosomal replication initiation ATPase DnaA
MTTLTLVQNAGIAINEAINLIISNNKVDEALAKLNEAKEYTDKMELMINPPVSPERKQAVTTLRKEVCNAFGISESEIFLKTRKREIVNARQVFCFCLISYKIPWKKGVGSSWLMRNIGWDHATHLHTCKVVDKYIDTEILYRELIPRLKEGMLNGTIDVPELPDLLPEPEPLQVIPQ